MDTAGSYRKAQPLRRGPAGSVADMAGLPAGAATPGVATPMAAPTSPAPLPRVGSQSVMKHRLASARGGELRCQDPECAAVLDVTSIPVEYDGEQSRPRRSPRVRGTASQWCSQHARGALPH
jgi:hypothetical protein